MAAHDLRADLELALALADAADAQTLPSFDATGLDVRRKADRTPDENDMLDMMLTGSERVKAENLSAVLEWYEGAKA